MEEIVEALLVAAATRSGAILSHGVHALLAFNGPGPGEGEPSEEAVKNAAGSRADPECFC